MHLLDQKILGIAVLFLLGMLVIVKRAATGSILDKPEGSFLVQLVNIFNLFFLLVVNPLTAVLLIAGRFPSIDPTHMTINQTGIATVMEATGLVLCLSGYLLMAWALTTLGHNYQLGGSAPRADDIMIMGGPYRLIRHPMYASALSIALGLAFLIQSWAIMGVFAIYVVLLIPLIPLEENTLKNAYDGQYSDYQHKTRRIIPFIY